MAQTRFIIKKVTHYGENNQQANISYLTDPVTDSYRDYSSLAHQFTLEADADTHLDNVAQNHADSFFEVKKIKIA